ncbi:MAG TPA: hypothetical protein VFS42_12670 [Burkholderiaceae bacterium]|nr:hypothetical protein [Burkholderiaceae bacterium]
MTTNTREQPTPTQAAFGSLGVWRSTTMQLRPVTGRVEIPIDPPAAQTTVAASIESVEESLTSVNTQTQTQQHAIAAHEESSEIEALPSFGGYFVGAAIDTRGVGGCTLYSPLEHSFESVPPVYPAGLGVRSNEPVLFIGDPTTSPLDGAAALRAYANFAYVPVIGIVHPAPADTVAEALPALGDEGASDLVVVMAYLMAERAYTRRPLTVVAYAAGAEQLRRALKMARALLFGRYRAQLPRSSGDTDSSSDAALTRATAALDSITVFTLGAPYGDDWVSGTRNVHLVNRSDALASKHYKRRSSGATQPAVFHFEDPPPFDDQGRIAHFGPQDLEHAHALETYLAQGLAALGATRRTEDLNNLAAKAASTKRAPSIPSGAYAT